VAQFHSLYNIYKTFVFAELKREFTEPALQNRAGIAQSIQQQTMGWMARVQSWQELVISPFSVTQGPTQSPIKCVPVTITIG
jgi:hypothetical protein